MRIRLPPFVQRVLNWIGSHELHVLIAFFVLAITIWGFVEIAGEVIEGTRPDLMNGQYGR